ncbi:SNW/SKI-interacting protein A [Lolium perenne]|uniref:SNW/SKI-interacting protein A n=1 Tax=Lolium perenne TaxID=4522 RepID=UPI0021F68600|nr:SNW/SKI-interacting protein A-like [Lolium perenne]
MICLVLQNSQALAMESSSTIPGSSPVDDDHHMSVDESDAVTALKNIARQRARRAGTNVHPTFINYDPSLNSAAFDSVTSRFVSLSEIPLDLLVPPKFKSRRLPRPGRSRPTPVMSSPPRLPSQKDQLDWKVPPCMSPWKNLRGYTIPLDKRQRPSEGGEELRNRISDNFVSLTESLRAAEVKARLMEMRAKLVLRREQELRRLAASARGERAAKAVVPAAPPVSVTEDPEDEKPKAKHGDSDICGAHADEQLEVTESLRAAEVKARLMEMRAKLVLRREQELQRLAASARAERAAKAVVPAAPPVSVTDDPEDEKPKAKHGDSDICGAHADEQLEKVTKKTDEGTPARAAGKRERPVELDEPEESDDPFDLDQFMAKFATLGMDEFDLDELLRSMLHIK